MIPNESKVILHVFQGSLFYIYLYAISSFASYAEMKFSYKGSFVKKETKLVVLLYCCFSWNFVLIVTWGHSSMVLRS